MYNILTLSKRVLLNTSMADMKDEEEQGTIEDGKSGPVLDYFCEFCKEENLEIEAGGYCADCKEYLCQACFNAHRRSRSTRHHKLIDQDHMPKSSSLSQEHRNKYTSTRCKKHNNNVVEYYCVSHNCFVCTDCFLKEHRRCDEIEVVLDESENIINSHEHLDFIRNLKDMEKRSSFMAKRIHDRKEMSMQCSENAEKQIRDATKEFHIIINEARKSLMAQMEAILLEDNGVNDEVKEIGDAIKVLLEETDNIADSKRVCQLYIQIKEKQNEVVFLEDRLRKVELRKYVKAITFEPNYEVRNAFQAACLGQFTVKKARGKGESQQQITVGHSITPCVYPDKVITDSDPMSSAQTNQRKAPWVMISKQFVDENPVNEEMSQNQRMDEAAMTADKPHQVIPHCEEVACNQNDDVAHINTPDNTKATAIAQVDTSIAASLAKDVSNIATQRVEPNNVTGVSIEGTKYPSKTGDVLTESRASKTVHTTTNALLKATPTNINGYTSNQSAPISTENAGTSSKTSTSLGKTDKCRPTSVFASESMTETPLQQGHPQTAQQLFNPETTLPPLLLRPRQPGSPSEHYVQRPMQPESPAEKLAQSPKQPRSPVHQLIQQSMHPQSSGQQSLQQPNHPQSHGQQPLYQPMQPQSPGQQSLHQPMQPKSPGQQSLQQPMQPQSPGQQSLQQPMQPQSPGQQSLQQMMQPQSTGQQSLQQLMQQQSPGQQSLQQLMQPQSHGQQSLQQPVQPQSPGQQFIPMPQSGTAHSPMFLRQPLFTYLQQNFVPQYQWMQQSQQMLQRQPVQQQQCYQQLLQQHRPQQQSPNTENSDSSSNNS